MFPPAPLRFSITTGWPSTCSSFLPKIRAMTSLGPPGAKPSTSVTSPVGKSCAHEAAVPVSMAMKTTARPSCLILPSPTLFVAIGRSGDAPYVYPSPLCLTAGRKCNAFWLSDSSGPFGYDITAPVPGAPVIPEVVSSETAQKPGVKVERGARRSVPSPLQGGWRHVEDMPPAWGTKACLRPEVPGGGRRRGADHLLDPHT